MIKYVFKIDQLNNKYVFDTINHIYVPKLHMSATQS